MYKLRLLFIGLLVLISSVSYSQDSCVVNVSCDIVSQYVNRGQNTGGSSPHAQPSLGVSLKNFEVGAWGSYGIVNNYNEIDVYVKYTFKRLSVQYMNYNMPNNTPNIGVGLFKPRTSYNVGEVSLIYNGCAKTPIKIFVATNVYNDSTKNDYSTYVEVSYPIYFGDKSLTLFTGATPFKSLYGSTGIINIGATFTNKTKITEDYSLPTYITICGNPQAGNLFLVFGVKL